MTQSRERVRVAILEYDEIATAIAARIAAVIRERQGEGRPAVLGLATGSTPIGIYRELIRLHREEGLDFTNVVTPIIDALGLTRQADLTTAAGRQVFALDSVLRTDGAG